MDVAKINKQNISAMEAFVSCLDWMNTGGKLVFK